MDAQNDAADIRGHIERLIEALHAKDLEGLAGRYAEDVVSFDVEPPLQQVGRAAKMRNWERVFAAFDDLNYEVRDLDLSVGGDVAVSGGDANDWLYGDDLES